MYAVDDGNVAAGTADRLRRRRTNLSLVYATFTLTFLGYEGAIMAQAVTALTHLDIHVSYVLVSVVMIPLTLYGMSFTAKFQAWTWPLWLGLIGLAIVSAATAPGADHHMVAPVTAGPANAAGLSAMAVFSERFQQHCHFVRVGYVSTRGEPVDNRPGIS